MDTFACNIGISGVGVYLAEVLRHIPASGAQYELFGWEFDRFAFSDNSERMEFVSAGRISGKMANSLWHVFRFPKFAASRKYDICFFPAAHRRLPSEFPCASVGTVHDMAAYWGTRQTREHLGAVIRLVLPNSLRKLDRIIAVSEWVKKELIELLNINDSRIEVIPNGIDMSIFYPRQNTENIVVEPFGFKQPYILYAARLHHPIKNHITLIKAFDIFKEKTKLPHRIVFAGSDDHGADIVRSFAYSSKYKNDIFFTGNFPSKNLGNLYAAASFAIFPSRYEGFGQGALEAMASGVPVACARAAALPETADHAALYFDPLSPEDMADRMITLVTDNSIRQSCREAGLERAKAFSWETCAARTMRVVQEII